MLRLFLDRFDGNIDAHFVADMRRVLARVERGALDHGMGVRADRILQLSVINKLDE